LKIPTPDSPRSKLRSSLKVPRLLILPLLPRKRTRRKKTIQFHSVKKALPPTTLRWSCNTHHALETKLSEPSEKQTMIWSKQS
jgi:hypothetical protein